MTQTKAKPTTGENQPRNDEGRFTGKGDAKNASGTADGAGKTSGKSGGGKDQAAKPRK